MSLEYALVDYYCPECYPARKNAGFIAGGMGVYGTELKGYCPVCNQSFTWRFTEEGSTLIKVEKGNNDSQVSRYDNYVVSHEVARVLV